LFVDVSRLTPIHGHVDDGGNYFVFYTMLDNTYKGEKEMLKLLAFLAISCLIGAVYNLMKES
tara:strand:+ start:349 stop:534 length:186 start_codon:yes stop_codon:yes gene_type:complete